jgi:8-oxo-dGTP diphosphatase
MPPEWPAGTKPEDLHCWRCGAKTVYRQCRIICSACGFLRDCSDP